MVYTWTPVIKELESQSPFNRLYSTCFNVQDKIWHNLVDGTLCNHSSIQAIGPSTIIYWSEVDSSSDQVENPLQDRAKANDMIHISI